MCNNNILDIEFEHIVLEGSSYEVGKIRGETLKQYPEEVAYYTSPFDGNEYLAQKEVQKVMKMFDRYCPELNDEISGLATSLNITPEQIAIYANSFDRNCGCSQMAILPTITQNQHIYVGRSYEFSKEDELRLCTTKVKGKPRHIGFSLHHIGRFDGMNEYGLCVTIANATPNIAPDSYGFKFWIVVRMLLDSCKNVEDAVQMLKQIPISANTSFLLADKNGNASLVEVASFNQKSYISIQNATDYIVSTNHYTLDDMKPYDIKRMWHSVTRYDYMKKIIENNKSKINSELLKKMLTNTIPNGLCCHYYEDCLGTLRSMIFDVTKQTVEICFGSPDLNPWREFDLNSTSSKKYMAHIQDDDVENPEIFWKILN